MLSSIRDFKKGYLLLSRSSGVNGYKREEGRAVDP